MRTSWAGPFGRPLLLGALLLAGTGPAQAATPPVSVSVELTEDRVSVPPSGATTLELNDPIHALVKIKVGEVEVSDYSPLVVVFVLDVSGSMGGSKMEQTRRAAAMVLEKLSPEDRISITTFENSARDLYSPKGTPDYKRAREIVMGLQAGGGTNMVGGLRLGMRKLKEIAAPGAVKRIFLLGDGDANVGSGDMKRIAAWARDHDAAVSSFGVGYGFNASVMEEIARASGGNFYSTQDESQLERIFTEELDEMKKNAGDQAQLVIKPTWGLEFGEVIGHEASLEAGPQIVSLRNLVAGTEHAVQLRLRRSPRTPPPGTAGRVDVSVSYLDEGAGDGRQAFGHADFYWTKEVTR